MYKIVAICFLTLLASCAPQKGEIIDPTAQKPDLRSVPKKESYPDHLKNIQDLEDAKKNFRALNG